MHSVSGAKSVEIDRNLDRFLELLPGLLAEHRGECALMRAGQIVDFFPTALEAQIAGNRRFSDRLFSIQEVQEFAEELGCFAYALPPRDA